MSGWQSELLEKLGNDLSTGQVNVYGSLQNGDDVDGWSDLDIRLRMSDAADVEIVFGARLWAWQESNDDTSQTLRLVFRDGRRVDAVITGHALALPNPPVDNDVRFRSALAATRLGRGNTVIGMHLWAGLLRDALELGMQLADREANSDNHPFPTRQDASLLAELKRLTISTPDPSLVIAVCDIYARWRSELESGYTADWFGLRAVIDRGRQ